jgi:hypothetical protein
MWKVNSLAKAIGRIVAQMIKDKKTKDYIDVFSFFGTSCIAADLKTTLIIERPRLAFSVYQWLYTLEPLIFRLC